MDSGMAGGAFSSTYVLSITGCGGAQQESFVARALSLRVGFDRAALRRTKPVVASDWLTLPAQTRAARTASPCGRIRRPCLKVAAMAVLDRGPEAAEPSVRSPSRSFEDIIIILDGGTG